jgi:YHS domain-containing protein
MAAVTDPVCGMQIESSEAAAQTMYENVDYYFCSEECRDRFMAHPEQYVKSQSS